MSGVVVGYGQESVYGDLADRVRAVLDGRMLPGIAYSKEFVRAQHDEARLARLRDARYWITDAWGRLGCRFANGEEISLERIDPQLVPVLSGWERDLFRLARYTWSLPYSRGYGRRLRFLVMDAYNGKMIGILGLQSAPIDFAPRDQRISYPEGRKVELVNQTMDVFTLGAVPPYNRLLGGKLVVYAAASNEVRDAYRAKYGGAVTELQGRVLPDHLVMLTTTSAFGRSSIYNRVAYLEPSSGRMHRVAVSLGYTKGYNSLHFDPLYAEIKDFLVRRGISANVGYGRGPRPVWQNIGKALTMLGIGGDGLKHGIRREVWCIPLSRNTWEYLSGGCDAPDYYDAPFVDLAGWWRRRWLLPRSSMVSDWRDWRRERTLESLLAPELD